MNRTPKNEKDALLLLASLCAQAEHCPQEMIDKMDKWEMDEGTQARIMEYLTKNRYIDEERFTRAFVADKIKYNKWGRRKIEQALWMKHISEDIKNRVLAEVPDEDYIAALAPLIVAKKKSVKGRNDYEKKMKLMKWAAGRGFDMEIIRQCIDREEDSDTPVVHDDDDLIWD